MFKAIWKLGNLDITTAKSIRKAVFVDEMGIAPSEIFDHRDAYAGHLEITDDLTNEPIATARIYPDHHNDCCSLSATHIGEIAVMKKYRTNKKYHDLALRMLLYKAEKLSGKQIVADIFPDELAMYESFGFTRTEEQCLSGKIRMHINRESINWHSECGE